MNNFRFYVDLSKIPKYGYCEIKTREQEYDTLFTLCMDKNKPWQNVERVYAFPWEVVINRNKTNITIARNSLKKGYWYEEFRIDKNPFNDIYRDMKLDNCEILKKIN